MRILLFPGYNSSTVISHLIQHKDKQANNLRSEPLHIGIKKISVFLSVSFRLIDHHVIPILILYYLH